LGGHARAAAAHPAAAGAPTPLARRRTRTTRSAAVKAAVEQWPVCLRDAHPSYIGWEEFMANQARRGCALLQGIAICSHGGRRMGVRCSGPQGAYPVHHCSADQGATGQPQCQEVRALRTNAEFERVLLEAPAPDQVVLAVAAVGQIQAETQAMDHLWGLKRDRARYEAERTRRQCNAVEPENRLVARSLERVWERRLHQSEAVEQAYAAWRGEQAGALADTECAEVLGLAHDLLRVWQAATAGRGTQAHAAPGHARGRPGPEARARPGLDADHLADRRHERAPAAAPRSGLCPLRQQRHSWNSAYGS